MNHFEDWIASLTNLVCSKLILLGVVWWCWFDEEILKLAILGRIKSPEEGDGSTSTTTIHDTFSNDQEYMNTILKIILSYPFASFSWFYNPRSTYYVILSVSCYFIRDLDQVLAYIVSHHGSENNTSRLTEWSRSILHKYQSLLFVFYPKVS